MLVIDITTNRKKPPEGTYKVVNCAPKLGRFK